MAQCTIGFQPVSGSTVRQPPKHPRIAFLTTTNLSLVCHPDGQTKATIWATSDPSPVSRPTELRNRNLVSEQGSSTMELQTDRDRKKRGQVKRRSSSLRQHSESDPSLLSRDTQADEQTKATIWPHPTCPQFLTLRVHGANTCETFANRTFDEPAIKVRRRP